MQNQKKMSRLASWGLFLALLFTVGTGFNPGSLKRCGCSVDPETLRALSDLAGRVRAAEDDAAISGARVALDARTTTTNGQGEFLFRDVEAGTYTLRVSAPGFRPVEQPLIWPRVDESPLEIPLVSSGARTMPLAVRDAKVERFDPIANFGTGDFLCFEWADLTLPGQATLFSYIDFDQTALPPGVTIQSVMLYGTRLPSSRIGGGGGDGGGDGGGGDGGGGDGGNEESARRFHPSAAPADVDIIFDAYAVLEGWAEDEINFLNRPREFSTAPVASVSLPTMTGDTYDFVMDLTQFAKDRQAGRLQAAGILMTGRDQQSAGGTNVHYITSSEYLPAEKALRIVAEYIDAAGKTVEVTLR